MKAIFIILITFINKHNEHSGAKRFNLLENIWNVSKHFSLSYVIYLMRYEVSNLGFHYSSNTMSINNIYKYVKRIQRTLILIFILLVIFTYHYNIYEKLMDCFNRQRYYNIIILHLVILFTTPCQNEVNLL